MLLSQPLESDEENNVKGQSLVRATHAPPLVDFQQASSYRPSLLLPLRRISHVPEGRKVFVPVGSKVYSIQVNKHGDREEDNNSSYDHKDGLGEL